jgi:hypothetical protein
MATSKLKRIAKLDDSVVKIKCPISQQEINERTLDYPVMTPFQFSKKYSDMLFKPVPITYKGIEYNIQMNFCSNPFCKLYGKDQLKFDSIKSKPSRYRLTGDKDSKHIACNPFEDTTESISLGCYSNPYSNWSIAEEIKRLATNDSVQDVEPEYNFHKPGCANIHSSPFEYPELFRKRGKSTGKSIKWQCKTCEKFTNVLPTRKENYQYHQKKNDIIPDLVKLLLSRVPIRRSCEILKVSPSTYYAKLEWVYKKCLEFLEVQEAKNFKTMKFDRIWLNADAMVYNLNNTRKRGSGGKNYEDVEVSQLPTYILVSGDSNSKYIFRADVSYDWNITQEQITRDTRELKEDHLQFYSCKNARYRFPFCPQYPTENDDQTYEHYIDDLIKYNMRSNYIEGMHVSTPYTAFAHYWLIKNTIKADKWRFVSDEDNVTMTTLYRVFSEEIRNGDALHFLCKIDKGKTIKVAFNEWAASRNKIRAWAKVRSIKLSPAGFTTIARDMLISEMNHHSFIKYKEVGGNLYPTWGKNPICHPLPAVDEGTRIVDCTCNVSGYTAEHLANLVLKVNNYAVNSFFQQIHRRLSILERPLVTARGDGKSYVYSNFNPRYAQYAITILRTYYNFCHTYKAIGGKNLTPAQQLGIANRKYNMNDIIYYK